MLAAVDVCKALKQVGINAVHIKMRARGGVETKNLSQTGRGKGAAITSVDAERVGLEGAYIYSDVMQSMLGLSDSISPHLHTEIGQQAKLCISWLVAMKVLYTALKPPDLAFQAAQAYYRYR